MNRVYSGVFLFLLIMPVIGFSGSVSKEYIAQHKQVMNYIQDARYKDALPLLQAMNQVNNNSNNEFYIGFCQFQLMFNKSVPLATFEKASKNIAKKYRNTAESGEAPNEVVYYQALCYHYLGENIKAKEKYEEYIRNSKENSSDNLVVNDAKRKLKLIAESPCLFSDAENQEIVNRRGNPKKINSDYKAKLANAMEMIQEDKIEAMILLKSMLKEYPDEPNANYMMGVCMLNITPYNKLATDYFTVSDKNSKAFKESGIGLDCPAIVKYYSGLSNQLNGDHKEALADFDAFNAVYPEEFIDFKPEFQKRVDYSKSMIANTDLASYNNHIDIIDTSGIKVLFPIMGTPVTTDNSSNQTASNNTSTYYYSVQVGAGNMQSTYFDKISDIRIAKYPSGMKRYLSGKYSSKKEALQRMNELVQLGYTDAFVTRMRSK